MLILGNGRKKAGLRMTRFPGDARLIVRLALIVAPIVIAGETIYRLLQWVGWL